jgi:cation diffusion facilitator CzcD-associated flavoprotein CzcO
MTTFAGFVMDFKSVNTFDEPPEQREAFFEGLWQKGGFHFWLAVYKHMPFNEKTNRETYDFWAKKTRARTRDRRKRTPLESPHAFGTKRPSLEQDFYGQFSKDNVDAIDIKANPIVETRPEGILTSDGMLHELDVIALATGFDSVTGGMKNIGLRNIYGEALSDTQKMGT